MTNKEPILFPSSKKIDQQITEKKQEFNVLAKQIADSYKELDRLKTDIDKLIKQKKKLIDSKCSLNQELFYIKQAIDHYEDSNLDSEIQNKKKLLAKLDYYIKSKKPLVETDKQARELIAKQLSPLLKCNLDLQDIIVWLKQQKGIVQNNTELLKTVKGTSKVQQGYLSPDVKEIMEDFDCYDSNYPTEEMLKNFYNVLQRLQRECYDQTNNR